MKIGCPTVSSQTGQICMCGRAQEVPAATGCPIAVEQAAPFQFRPQGRAQEREKPGEAVAPLSEEGAAAQQQIHQQRGPHLPAHGAGVVPEEVGQLQRLFEFLEEYLDAPAAAQAFLRQG